jgi:predicted enzyme related to lactoylglutathione lyase
MKPSISYNHIAPQFVVKNVEDSINFYSQILGFKVDYLSGSPPNYAVVFRNEVYIHLCVKEQQDYTVGPGSVFMVVNGIEKIWENIQNSNIEIISPLADQDYSSNAKFKVFTIYDLDKNVLRIGEKI